MAGLRVVRRSARRSLILVLVGCGAAGPPVGADDDPDSGAMDASGADAGAMDGDVRDGGLDDLIAMCGAAPAALEDWELCYLKRHCEMRVHCGEWNLFTDVQECIDLADAVTGGRLAFEAHERRRAIAAGRASIDVATFTQCLADLSPDRCDTAATAPSCALRFAGTVADGETCYGDIECESPGAHCEPRSCGDSCCQRVCEPRAGVGEPCDDFVDSCEPGLMCSIETATCVGGDIGSRCTDGSECDPDAWCDEEAEICKADVPEGAPCTGLLQCGGETLCVGLRREIEPARCLRTTHAGDACDWFCLGNLFCDLSNPKGFGTCRSLPGPDQSCSPFVPCAGRDQYCVEGTCVRRDDIDQPCSDGTCLPGLFCSDQLGASDPVCRARSPDGEGDCNQPGQCESYICSGDSTQPGECQPWRDSCP